MKNDFVCDLKSRGCLKDATSGFEDFFKTKEIKCYCGTDPTAESLHVGHLIPIMALVRFVMKCKGQAFFLIGGATGMIGDPSFKSSERVFSNVNEIFNNRECIKKQVERIFCNIFKGDKKVEVVDNFDWYSSMNVVDFLREGKNITVNYMSAKESVKKRIDDGMSFTEFSYQILQAYDFYFLNRKYGVNLQIGGADQWGNITTGIDFIRKKTGEIVHGLTMKLFEKSDGTKFGKTENGAVWLDRNKTLPYEFYQFWLNRGDDEAIELIKILSLKNFDDIKVIIEEHLKNPQNRLLQKKLAEEMTEIVHGKKDFEESVLLSDVIYGGKSFDNIVKIVGVKEIFLKTMKNTVVSKDILKNCENICDFICETCVPVFFKSKKEVRRFFEEKAISVNKESVVANESFWPFITYGFALIQRGKKNHFVVFIE